MSFLVPLAALLATHLGAPQEPAAVAPDTQPPTVSGTIVGSVSAEPLPAVRVRVKGKSQSTMSNSAGRYAATVASLQDTLVFTRIGYEPQQIAIDGRSAIDVRMVALPTQIEAQVVTAYRVQDRGTVTGAVSTVGHADIADVPVDNLSNALQGRLSGVTVTQNAGTPGQMSNIRVRAVGTFNDADPLYVIDGIVSDKFAFDGLNPEDVENISVLKDGATAALYGSRAANGVVLVTTRRGAVKATEFSYDVTVGAQNAPRIPSTLDAYQHAQTINDYLSYNRIPTTDVRYYTDDELQYYQTHSWDWIGALWKQPLDVQHALSITGGSDGVRYFLGGSFLDATGSFSNLSFGRTTARGNLDVDLTSHLRASLDFNGARQNRHGPSWTVSDTNWAQEDLYKALALRTRMVPPYQAGLPVGNWVEWNPGVVISNQSGYDRREWSQLNVRGRLEYQVPWVTGLSASLGYYKGYTDTYEKQFNMPYDMTLFNTWGGHNHIIGDSAVGTRPRAAEEFLLTKDAPYNQYQLNAQVTYKHAFGRHAVDALFVYEQAASDSSWALAQRDSFVTDIDQYVAGSTAPGNQSVNGREEQTARLSYVGSVGYSYADRYYLQGSFRYDGSVIFAPAHRWGLFPSVSAGWRLTQEPFFHVPFFNELKLRASYGVVGNDDVGAFQWAQKYVLNTGAIFGSPTTGLSPGPLANPGITWEKSQSYNAGIDSRFWNNRVSLTLDAFYRHTYDILGTRQDAVTDIFGATLPDENWEVVNAHGFEVELGYSGGAVQAEPQGALKYYIRGHFGYGTNAVVALNEPDSIRSYLSRIGRPTSGNLSADNSACFGYIATGILRTQADLDALPPGYTINGQKPQLGMLNYKDLRGQGNGNDSPDGKITSDDQAWLCSYAKPPMTYGVSMGLSWKGLSLDALVSGAAGNNLMMHADGRAIQGRAEESSYGFWADHWTPANPNAAYPGYFATGYKVTYPASTFWLRDGSFLRLKAVTVSYGLPQRVARFMGLAGARVYLTGTNLLLLMDHLGDWGYDPEMDNIRAYPLMRTFTFGLSANLRRAGS